MKQEEKEEARFGGMTLEEVGELLKAYTEESDWALSRMARLRKRYPNMFIAVVGKRVIASSESREDVVAELEKRGLKPNFTFLEYIPKNRVKYLLHDS